MIHPSTSRTTARRRPRRVQQGARADARKPKAFVLLPARLLADLRDTPLAIGIYAFIGRLFLVEQCPLPLSASDIRRYDPSLSRGAILRALDRLVRGGWLIESRGTYKTHYTPTWG